jgi:hypothetical protein
MLKPKFIDGNVVAINLGEEAPLIEGYDFLGRKAWIKFRPTVLHGWFGDRGDSLCEQNWPIEPASVVAKKRRLCLLDNRDDVWMNFFEHIAPLRLLGLDSVGISCGPNSHPPWYMAGELWDKLSPYLQYADYVLEWKQIEGRGIAHCSDIKTRSTDISPGAGGPSIFIDSYIDYSSLGKSRSTLPYGADFSWDELQSVLLSPTQGWPKTLYPLAIIAGYLGWPHCRRVCWPQKSYGGKKHILDLFDRHRQCDILGIVGAMSMVDKQLLSCQVNSYKGGHESDVGAFENILSKS